MRTSPPYIASYRIEVDEKTTPIASIVDAVSSTGAEIKGLDMTDFDRGRIIVNLTCDIRDSEHRREVRGAVGALPGVTADSVSGQTSMSHTGGKVEIHSKVSLRNRDDLSHAYTPGAARMCTAIHDISQKAHLLTMKANTVVVVSDGTAVFSLGDISPEAALPVVEGKTVLFKEFGGVDTWPVVLDTKDTEEVVSIVKAITPAYGGINLEDISAPRCFEIEEHLRAEFGIPVFHDGQHGTAVVVLSALANALKIVGKKIEDVRIVVPGVGAAGNAIIRLLFAQGARDIIGCDRDGALSDDDTEGMHPFRKALAEATNPRHVHGSLKEVLKGVDVFIGVFSGNILDPSDVETMADDAIIFVLVSPTPEVDSIGAGKYVAVVATDRNDYPSQINNVLAFPGLFRGLLDARVKEITTEVLRIASVAIASAIPEDELSPSYTIPGAFDKRVAPAVSKAVRRAVRDPPIMDIPVQPDMGVN